MDAAEFDLVAEEYRRQLADSLRASGEAPDYFHEYKVAHTAAALGAVKAGAPLRILDFGTGIGNSVPYLRRYFPAAALTGADVSGRSLELARERFPDAADFRHIEGVPLPLPEGGFDLIFTACVFHHIPWPEHGAVLADLRRLLAPGGHLFVFEHNPWNPLTRHVVATCPFDRNARLIAGPVMRRRVLEAGFAEARTRYRLFFPRRLAGLRRWEPALAGLPLGAQYVIEARRGG